jgi:hypothetical protein
MNYLDTIKEAHDLVCKARNLLDETRSTMSCDTDVNVEVDILFDDWTAALEEVEDQLFSGCNIADINELPESVEV